MRGILLVNKEEGYTSHDVVMKLRQKLKIKKIGHTGTLDPEATGLLVIVVGKSTKLVPYLQKDDKKYKFDIKLGVKTDTLDIWGEVCEKTEPPKFKEQEIKNVFKSMIGQQKQMPPMFSAIKQDGKKLYELARQGKEVEREKRNIEIYDLEFLSYDDEKNIISGFVHCSSGTYVRTLCADISERLGTIGSMSLLERTAVGNFELKDAKKIEDINFGDLTKIKTIDALKGFEEYKVSDPKSVYHGKELEIDSDSDEVLIVHQGEPIAVYAKLSEKRYKCKRGLW